MSLAGLGVAAPALFAQSGSEAERMAFFERHIRPVLVAECYSCHSAQADEIGGGLTLDTRDGIRQGGDTGPAVVPGSASRSLLVKAIRQTDPNLQMPPDKKLPAEVIANFERWIAQGADDPRDGEAAVARKYEIDIQQGRQYWAFQVPCDTVPPPVRATDWPRSDIDRFVLAAMEAQGAHPVADADPHSLVRRLYLDLIGLPPSPDDVSQFVALHAQDAQAAVAATVDKLLENPGFGERWGRHWLDVVRYAESSGQATNFAFPHAWRYRDWVIESLNADTPYDQFIRQQLAGDLLPAEDERQRAANMVATGFLAIGPKSLSERNRQQFQADVVDEQIDATFQAFQALTVACARCHDHRFDPIPQTDYYALAGIFRSTETCYGTIRVVQSNHPSPLLELPREADATQPYPPLTAARRELIERQIESQQEQMAELTSRDQLIRRIFMASRVTQLRSQLDLYDGDGMPRPLAMGVRESRQAADSPLYIRGEINQPSDRVERGFPQVLTVRQPAIGSRSSGRRELADWIASPDNPLTARVMANRVWLHLIGRGLVATPDNFGASGQPPSHPELLDYLAVRFVQDGWSIKRLIRSIVLSRTYQLSSQFDYENFEKDPENVLVWRMPKRRLEAEALRDSMLLLGGNLNLQPPAGSLVARGGEGNVGFRITGDPAATETNRSVYLPIVRDQLPEMLTVFDFPDPSLIVGERAATTIPAQSLYLMNNPFVQRQADGLASRVMQASEDDVERIKQAWLLGYSRPPTDSEINLALKFLDDYGVQHSVRATWAAFCQAILASAEFAQR
ncbi:MAG: PSD1 domain-containing protein [Pirellulaceae bacterium]|nr:PSD1 domain-containing protein [Pirellulaceae bacterium]